jgi:hypothetical protein
MGFSELHKNVSPTNILLNNLFTIFLVVIKKRNNLWERCTVPIFVRLKKSKTVNMWPRFNSHLLEERVKYFVQNKRWDSVSTKYVYPTLCNSFHFPEKSSPFLGLHWCPMFAIQRSFACVVHKAHLALTFYN